MMKINPTEKGKVGMAYMGFLNFGENFNGRRFLHLKKIFILCLI